MKHLKFLLIITITVLVGACEEKEPTDNPVTVEDGTYIGTLNVDQNDGTFHTQDNVSIVLEVEESSATIKMMQVSFASGMPVKLDMTIPDITTVAISEGLSLSGDSIVPLAMGGEFPVYTIKELTGEVTPETIYLNMMCGVYPLTFSGIVLGE
jgi:hypothetical protein